MSDRSEGGTGSLGSSDADLGGGITDESGLGAGAGLGGASVGGTGFSAAADSSDLGASTGGFGSGTAAGSARTTGMGSTDLGGSDFDSAASGTVVPSTATSGGMAGDAMTGGVVGSAGMSNIGSSGATYSGTTGSETTTTVAASAGTEGGETSSGAGEGGGLGSVAMGALAGAAIGAAASAILGSGGRGSGTSSIERSIEVNAPVSTVYNQWTQFEEFPRFMQGVERVQQLDDKRLHWHADIGFKEKEWDAEIVDQVPDQHIAWTSTSGARNGGAVGFQSVGADRTLVTLTIDYDPEGLIENVGDTLGLVGRRVEGDLERFKAFIESRGAETGGWRGEIHGAG